MAYQTEVYQRASDAQHALKVIVYFTAQQLIKVQAILKELGLETFRRSATLVPAISM